MRTITCLFAALLLLHAPSVSAQSAPSPSSAAAPGSEDTTAERRAAPRHLVGTWRSATDRMRLATAFDVSVWGQDASSVRDVELNVPATGPATLTVRRKVVDAKGRTVAGSASVEQARIVIGDAQPGQASRLEHEVTVVSAERRYPETPESSWDLEGLEVRLTTFADDEGTVEVRFDTPEGRGSFWETLRKAGGRQQRAAR
jgi:hypothetical protein